MNTSAAIRLKAFSDALNMHQTHPDFIDGKHRAQIQNPWFTQESIEKSIQGWQAAMSAESQIKWLAAYSVSPENKTERLGIIGAGNIPFVVMHDVICGVITGFPISLKLSSDDSVLPKVWIALAEEIYGNTFQISFTDQLKDIDRIIATGSNNTNRYFEYYFKNKPHLLRKNRHSLAVLPEVSELSDAQIMGLGEDIFAYFGMGCRNVTQIWVPENFDFTRLFMLWDARYGDMINHHKYVNNYHYHRALLLMNLDPHIDSGFVLFKERNTLHAPVGMVNYTFYKDINEVREYIHKHHDEIQCVVSEGTEISALPFGTAQSPDLWDFADGVDTLKWLS